MAKGIGFVKPSKGRAPRKKNLKPVEVTGNHASINKILDSAQKELEPPKVKYSRKIGLERTEEYRFVAETIKNIEIQNRREILRFLETAERNGT